jgi:aminoglycoside phosphotransferase (APT) family kinase protein
MENHNMFSDDDRTTLIDFELSCFAHPLTEIAQLLIFSFDNSDFISAFMKTKTMSDICKNKNQVSTLRTLSLYEVFVQLAFGPKTDYSRNSSFLKYLTNNYEN